MRSSEDRLTELKASVSTGTTLSPFTAPFMLPERWPLTSPDPFSSRFVQETKKNGNLNLLEKSDESALRRR